MARRGSRKSMFTFVEKPKVTPNPDLLDLVYRQRTRSGGRGTRGRWAWRRSPSRWGPRPPTSSRSPHPGTGPAPQVPRRLSPSGPHASSHRVSRPSPSPNPTRTSPRPLGRGPSSTPAASPAWRSIRHRVFGPRGTGPLPFTHHVPAFVLEVPHPRARRLPSGVPKPRSNPACLPLSRLPA